MTTQAPTSATLKQSDVTTRTNFDNIRTSNSTWPATGVHFQQEFSTSLIKQVSTTTSSQYDFQPGMFPGEDGPRLIDRDDDVVFYVDSMLDGEENLTRRYDGDYYLDVDDDDLRPRDLERVVIESAANSNRNHVTSSTPRDRSLVPPAASSSSVVGGRRPDAAMDSGSTAAETRHHQPSSVTSWITSTTTRRNSEGDDEDWWRQFPFLGSVLTTTMTATSSANTLTASDVGTSTTSSDDTASSTTLRYTMPTQITVPDISDIARSMTFYHQIQFELNDNFPYHFEVYHGASKWCFRCPA